MRVTADAHSGFRNRADLVDRAYLAPLHLADTLARMLSSQRMVDRQSELQRASCCASRALSDVCIPHRAALAWPFDIAGQLELGKRLPLLRPWAVCFRA